MVQSTASTRNIPCERMAAPSLGSRSVEASDSVCQAMAANLQRQMNLTATPSEGTALFQSIPLELFNLIVNNSTLDLCSLTLCRQVCRRFRQVVQIEPSDLDHRWIIAGWLGYFKVLQWAKTQGANITSRVCQAIARAGHLQMLPWAIANTPSWNSQVEGRWLCEAAAKGGQHKVLQWARNRGCDWGWRVLCAAAKAGHRALFLWAAQNGAPLCKATGYAAASSGQLELLKWMHQKCVFSDGDSVISEKTCIVAAQHGQRLVVQWLQNHRAPWNDNFYLKAARDGHLDFLKWARKAGAHWDEPSLQIAAEEAARHGHLHVLQWLRKQHATPWHSRVFAAAASYGDIAILEWLKINNCQWDCEACGNAALKGNLPVLQWLRANGTPWNNDWVCRHAREKGHTEILAWALANGVKNFT